MYANGEGVLKDLVRAYMWFSIAADNGSDAATKYIKIFEDELSYAEISKAQKMSSICLESNYTDCWDKSSNGLLCTQVLCYLKCHKDDD